MSECGGCIGFRASSVIIIIILGSLSELKGEVKAKI